MSQSAFTVAVNIPVIIIIFCLGLFLPEFSSSNMLFGMNIPPDQRHSPILKDLILKYKKLYIAICGIYTVGFILVFYYIGKYYVLLPGLVLLVFIMQIVYYVVYKKIRQLDMVVNWNKTSNSYTIIDDRKKDIRTALQGWFVIPALILIFSLALGAAIYPNTPMLLPSGILKPSVPASWVKKSVKLIFMCPLLEMMVTVILYYVFLIINKLKPYKGDVNMEIIEHQNNVFHKIWSVAIIAVCSLFNIMLFFLHLRLFILISSRIFILVCILIMAVIASIIIFSYTTVKNKNASVDVSTIKTPTKKKTTSVFIDRNDGNCWLLGNFYFNPHDPSLFIKDSNSKGINLNFGRPLAWIIISILMMIFLLTFIYLYINEI